MSSSDETILQGLAPIAEQMGTTAPDLLAGLRAESAKQRPAPAVTLALTGLPDSCPHCDVTAGEVAEWLLGVHGTMLQVICPCCFTAVAPVRARKIEDATGLKLTEEK